MIPDNYFDSIEHLVRKQEMDLRYKKLGFYLWKFDERAAMGLNGFFENQVAMREDDCDPNYYLIGFHNFKEIVEVFNKNIEIYTPPLIDKNAYSIDYSNPSVLILEQLLKQIAPQIEALLGFSFRVVNVKATKSLKETESVGPAGWHFDGFSNAHRKIMFYLNAMNDSNGTLEIISPERGYVKLETDGPSIVLAEIAHLTHRGVPPSVTEKRPMIEVTIIPSFITSVKLKYGGVSSRCPLPSMQELEEIYMPLIEKVNPIEAARMSKSRLDDNSRNS